MRYWIDFISRHHRIEQLTGDKVKIPCIGFDENHRELDHIITAHEGFYTVDEYYHDTGEHVTTWEEQSIKEYLGY